MASIIKEILKENGPRAFLKGLYPNLFLVINPIINFVVYEWLRKKVVKSGAPGFIQIFFISLIAKTIATIITYPMLTLKTLRYMETENITVMQTLIKNLKENGPYSFYRGISIKLVQSTLYNAFMMSSFEKIQFLVKSLLMP